MALVGRPNVGKSSLLNRLAREDRAVVDSVAGTTVDPVDSLVEIGGEIWQLVDTAGLRKRVGRASGTEYYAVLRTAGAIEAAEVAVVLLDAGEVDQRAGPADPVDGRRGRPGAGHRLQQVGPGRRRPALLPGQGDRPGAAAHPVGAPAQHLGEDRPGGGQAGAGAAHGAGELGAAGADRRSSTSGSPRSVQATPHPVRGGRAPRVLFATQAGACPPRFVLFTTGLLDAGYVRFVERKLREEFGFSGTPVQISVRPRKKSAK